MDLTGKSGGLFVVQGRNGREAYGDNVKKKKLYEKLGAWKNLTKYVEKFKIMIDEMIQLWYSYMSGDIIFWY